MPPFGQPAVSGMCGPPGKTKNVIHHGIEDVGARIRMKPPRSLCKTIGISRFSRANP
jgi:hypothetical protein